MKCIKCGADLAEGVLFCRECGAKIDTTQKRFCRECGAKLEAGVKFCSECGAKTDLPTIFFKEEDPRDNSEDPSNQKETGLNERAQKTSAHEKAVLSDTNRNIKYSSPPKANKPTHQKKKSSKVPLVVAAVSVIAAVAILIIASVMWTSDSSQSSNNNVSRTVDPSVTERPKITMPNVINMAYPAALNILQSAGFSNITSNVDPNTDEALWVVTEQGINAGKSIKPDSKIVLTCARRCKLYLDIHSEANLMFSTYDISIALDGVEIGTVANGKGFTFLKEVVSGEHTLVFCKSGSTSPKATKKFLVPADMTFSCDLGHSGSSIEIKNESRVDNIGGASLKVEDVTGMVLSEAITKLNNIGFSNVREEPYNSIWNKSNWIVVTQSLTVGSVVDKNEFFQLDCISLDDYFSKNYVGKTINEIQILAKESGFSLRFEDESWSDLSSKVASMSDTQKNDWVATKARQYGGADKTATVTIRNSKEVTPTSVRTPVPTRTPTPASTVAKYDIDEDLVVTECKRDKDKTTMYHIAFAEIDGSTSYSFSSIINPRTMGKNFNSIGDLPSWFYVGATVHVKANLYSGHLSTSKCEVSEATGTTNSSEAKSNVIPMPVMPGTSIDTITQKARELGMKTAYSDENFGHGTKMRPFEGANGGLSLDVCYSASTKEILYGAIVTNRLASASEQRAFIIAMAPLLCPSSDKESVTNWISSNIGSTEKTTINGFVYEVGVGAVENPWLEAGVRSWEEWEFSFD